MVQFAKNGVFVIIFHFFYLFRLSDLAIISGLVYSDDFFVVDLILTSFSDFHVFDGHGRSTHLSFDCNLFGCFVSVSLFDLKKLNFGFLIEVF